MAKSKEIHRFRKKHHSQWIVYICLKRLPARGMEEGAQVFRGRFI